MFWVCSWLYICHDQCSNELHTLSHALKFQSADMKGSEHLGEVHVLGMIMLKWMWKNRGVKMRTAFTDWPTASCCQHGNKVSGSTKRREGPDCTETMERIPMDGTHANAWDFTLYPLWYYSSAPWSTSTNQSATKSYHYQNLCEQKGRKDTGIYWHTLKCKNSKNMEVWTRNLLLWPVHTYWH